MFGSDKLLVLFSREACGNCQYSHVCSLTHHRIVLSILIKYICTCLSDITYLKRISLYNITFSDVHTMNRDYEHGSNINDS